VGDVPPGVDPQRAFPAAFELIWRTGEGEAPATPIAARCDLRLGKNADPISEFDFAYGGSTLSAFGSQSHCSTGWSGVPGAQQSIVAQFASVGPADLLPHATAELPEDGEYTGRIDLYPSRDVALATQTFLTYYGDVLSYPVQIEIETVDGPRP